MSRLDCPFCPVPTPLSLATWQHTQGLKCRGCGFEVRGRDGAAVSAEDVRAVGEELGR